MVVFYPTHKAARFLTQLRQEVLSGDEWHQAKERLLERLRETQESNYIEAVREILAQLPDIKTPLMYCTEMIGILLLNLAYASQHIDEFTPRHMLNNFAVRNEVGLGAFAGLSLGSIISNQTGDPSLVGKLISHTKKFQTYLSELSEESVNRLTNFLQDALNTFES
jgi:hypothetical protein